MSERYSQAVEWAEKAARARPDLEGAHRALAASYAQLDKVDEAHHAVTEMLRIDPDISLQKIERELTLWNPDPTFDFELQMAALRKAGLPE
jgi:adenylate cyclase